MSFAPYISPLQADALNASGFWHVFFARLRLWLGLNIGADESLLFEPDAPATPRHRRLEMARSARLTNGVPVGRSTAGLRPLLPRGLSRTQYLEACCRLSSMGRFQIYDWLYYRWEFWNIPALRARNVFGVFTPLIARQCHAPLKPD